MQRSDMFRRSDYSNPTGRTPREILIRCEMPYGMWTLKDGSVFLYNRCYENLVGKDPNGGLIIAHPDKWHGKENPIVKHDYFYNDLTNPVRNKKTLEKVMQIKHEFLTKFGIPKIIKESIVFTLDERLERTK